MTRARKHPGGNPARRAIVENLLTIEGPGRLVCEQTYTADIAARPCPGDPS